MLHEIGWLDKNGIQRTSAIYFVDGSSVPFAAILLSPEQSVSRTLVFIFEFSEAVAGGHTQPAKKRNSTARAIGYPTLSIRACFCLAVLGCQFSKGRRW